MRMPKQLTKCVQHHGWKQFPLIKIKFSSGKLLSVIHCYFVRVWIGFGSFCQFSSTKTKQHHQDTCSVDIAELNEQWHVPHQVYASKTYSAGYASDINQLLITCNNVFKKSLIICCMWSVSFISTEFTHTSVQHIPLNRYLVSFIASFGSETKTRSASRQTHAVCSKELLNYVFHITVAEL